MAPNIPALISTPLNPKRAARNLGWFSLGLGLTEVLAPRALDYWLGTKRRTKVTRAFGLREIAAGAGLLGGGKLAPWMWARVAGDALDIGALMAARTPRNRKKGHVTAALAVVGAITALDVLCATQVARLEA